MAERIVKMWFDAEADFREVIFEQKGGYFRATDNRLVMQKVDSEGERHRFLSAARQFPQEETSGGCAPLKSSSRRPLLKTQHPGTTITAKEPRTTLALVAD
ncbi:MAG: hypothetical protein ACLQOO_25180 [Terriglobia bacterium]